jgi:hypothetical protein
LVSTRRITRASIASRLTSHQIAEVVYITIMFAFFNREADAFDISPQRYLEMNAMTE